MAWQTEGPLAVARGFIPNGYTRFWGTYFLWRDTLLSLDIVGRAWAFPRALSLTLSEEWMEVGFGKRWKEWEEERDWEL